MNLPAETRQIIEDTQAVYNNTFTVDGINVEKITVKVPIKPLEDKKKMFWEDAEELAVEYFRTAEGIRMYKCCVDAPSLVEAGVICTPGIPDFYYVVDGVLHFMEVKSMEDGLRYTQLKWIKEHPSARVRVVYIRTVFAEEDEEIPWFNEFSLRLSRELTQDMKDMLRKLMKKHPEDDRWSNKLKEIEGVDNAFS